MVLHSALPSALINPRCSESLDSRLAQIPSHFGRLVYLSLWRNTETGRYEEPEIAREFGEAEASRALGHAHTRLFLDWLGLHHDQQKSELETYRPSKPPHTVPLTVTLFRMLVPPDALEPERDRFVGDLTKLVPLLSKQPSSQDLSSAVTTEHHPSPRVTAEHPVVTHGVPQACRKIPMEMEELGLPESLLSDLVIRRLSIAGKSSFQSLSRTLKLSFPVVETVFRFLRQQGFCEVKGMEGDDYVIMITGAGRIFATERFQMCQYAGPAPVPLSQYQEVVKAQCAHPEIDREILRKAFSDLVVSDELLDELGPAVISQSSIFLYGSAGTGKTSLAERLIRAHTDAVLVPYAVEVDGQIINLYDPVAHHPVASDEEEHDPRWVLCRRPCIVVGGEMTPEMLDLRLDPISGIYAAPLQMKANNGIFIIDDFGRQRVTPGELLNRWIVPLDRKLDYLSLQYGLKFQIPFELMVVFSSNMDPSELGDEAFLRRIQTESISNRRRRRSSMKSSTAAQPPESCHGLRPARNLCEDYASGMEAASCALITRPRSARLLPPLPNMKNARCR